MNIRLFKKFTAFSILMMITVIAVIFSSCGGESQNKKTQENIIKPDEAWSFVESGFKKTATSTGYDISYKTKSNSVFADRSNNETSEHVISMYGIGTPDFTADAKSEYSDTPTEKHYYFDSEKYYTIEKKDGSFSSPYLYISDDIDVLKEVTGLNVFKINIDKVKSVMDESKKIVKGEENGLQYIKFAITSQNAKDILGESYHVFQGMENFTGSMFFYNDSDGYLVKFGYESSYSDEEGDEKASNDLLCEYFFTNINKTKKILAPKWASTLQPEEIDTVKYIKDKVLYSFVYEESESTKGYGYKFYWVENTEDPKSVVKFAEIPEIINGVKVTDVSRMILIFGEGAEVMVFPKTINYLPYPSDNMNTTIFSKCDEFVEDIQEGMKAYTANEWEYVNGVPTVKEK